jgi:glycosyltransferase involved in cell wall biosynthesis
VPSAAVSQRRPTVSVVVPCYRYGRYLRECVSSALDQEGVDVRVLIIDDASPDDSADVAASLAGEDDRVELRRHHVNRGHIATYNEGLLAWADGEYSVLISADDVLTPGSLARATSVLAAHPDVGFVYGHARYWDDRGPRPPARLRQTGTTVWPGIDWLKIVSGLGHSVISSPEVVVRTSVQHEVGPYSAQLPHTADAEMWMRFAAHADVAYIKGADQAFYRIHGSQMTVERVRLVDLQQRKAAYDGVFEAHADRIPGATRLRRRADRKLAREALWGACRAYERRRIQETPISDLADFATATYPGVRRLPEYWGLRWRRLVGPQMCPYLQPIMVSAMHRKLRSALWWRRWAREGV